LGLPTGRAAAVPNPAREMTSDESHLKLEGYFSSLVQKAKAKDHYDEKTAIENKALAVKRLQVRSRVKLGREMRYGEEVECASSSCLQARSRVKLCMVDRAIPY